MRLLEIASAEIGTKEIPGAEHNARILQYAQEAGFDWVNSDETPWCSIFLNWAVQKAGLQASKDARAQSWMEVGEAIAQPELGDIVLFGSSSNSIYHVGIFMGYSKECHFVFTLGGNQGDQVDISKFAASQVQGFRRLIDDPSKIFEVEMNPPSVPQPTPSPETNPEETFPETPEEKEFHQPALETKILVIPTLKLKFGDKGVAVEDLQYSLNIAGFDCGKPDGIFGPGTARAIRDLQLQGKINPNGTYNKKTRKFLEHLLSK
ncbi:TIGR02594 family protein [Rapidithrix thailandica]|uniref:TIGR02594 family protein n=1 Tax=Rapidithrix thailandica TaxID=413964 RepID=A0AAW9RMV5_9BACT